jgi:hypothetical protein
MCARKRERKKKKHTKNKQTLQGGVCVRNMQEHLLGWFAPVAGPGPGPGPGSLEFCIKRNKFAHKMCFVVRNMQERLFSALAPVAGSGVFRVLESCALN